MNGSAERWPERRPPPGADQVFAEFVAWHNARGKGNARPLSAPSSRLYGYFWGAYTRFLEEKCRSRWDQATVAHTKAFMATVKTKGHGAKEEGEKVPSKFTSRRYARVLQRIYEYALKTYEVDMTTPPVRLDALPPRKREDAETFVMHSSYRKRLLERLRTDAQGYDSRDHAMLALMLMQGLTPQELIALETCHLIWDEDEAPPLDPFWRQAPWPDPPRPVALRVPKTSREAQSRTLELDPLTATTLQQWLRWRGTCIKPGGQQVLLPGRRKEKLDGVRIYEVAAGHIGACLLENGGEEQRREKLRHVGPLTLRNSALRQWLDDGTSVPEVLRRAGLARSASLARLIPFLTEDAAARVRNQVDAEKREDADGVPPKVAPANNAGARDAARA